MILKSQQIFKSERHNVDTEEINKVVLSISDDKRLQTYGTSAGKVCKTELLSKVSAGKICKTVIKRSK